MKILDCTLRDGGYYNKWNFPSWVVECYLKAMAAVGVDIVELGLRSTKNEGFKGASAYTSDSYLASLNIPDGLKVAVMVNASELVGTKQMTDVLEELFPTDCNGSVVSVVRIACHVHEFEKVLAASIWLKDKGYTVGYNLMQVAERSKEEVELLAKKANSYPIDVLYFADSMGSMRPEDVSEMINSFRLGWEGTLGIHTHDNMGLALSNTMEACKNGVEWLDSTVTGMGRGPGNARTEELVLETASSDSRQPNIVPLMELIRSYFQPLKNKCGWGSNPYYFLAGKYGIHPTYIQEMLSDSRYSEEDILAAIEQLKVGHGAKFSFDSLGTSTEFYKGEPKGSWDPKSIFENRDVLILGTGPGVAEHKAALERFISENKPIVIALNTSRVVCEEQVDFRIACHPIRLLADCHIYGELPQPLITPLSMLPTKIAKVFEGKAVMDYGIKVEQKMFNFNGTFSYVPKSLVACYALAVTTAGRANSISLAGFDGYDSDDPRNHEMNELFKLYESSPHAISLTAITPTRYEINERSVYGPR